MAFYCVFLVNGADDIAVAAVLLLVRLSLCHNFATSARLSTLQEFRLAFTTRLQVDQKRPAPGRKRKKERKKVKRCRVQCVLP